MKNLNMCEQGKNKVSGGARHDACVYVIASYAATNKLLIIISFAMRG